MLSRGVAEGLWPQSSTTWQHPMEWLQIVPPPPPPSVVRGRAAYSCVLRRLEGAAARLGREAVALLPRYAVQTEGLSRPHGGCRVISDCHFRKTGPEYDRKPGIKWLSCTESDNRI